MSRRKIASQAGVVLSALVCMLGAWALPPVARAETPSVDAYAGQALVLGKPHKKPASSAHTGSRSGRSTSEESEGADSGSTSTTQPPSSGSGRGSGASTVSTQGATGGVHSQAASRSATAHRTASSRASQTAAASQRSVTALQPASSTLPLSGADAALLALAILLVAATAFALRRTRPSA